MEVGLGDFNIKQFGLGAAAVLILVLMEVGLGVAQGSA